MAVAETAQPMFARHQHGSWNIVRNNASAYPFIVAFFVMIGTSNSVILVFENFQLVFEPDCNHQQGDLHVSLFCSRWYCYSGLKLHVQLRSAISMATLTESRPQSEMHIVAS